MCDPKQEYLHFYFPSIFSGEVILGWGMSTQNQVLMKENFLFVALSALPIRGEETSPDDHDAVAGCEVDAALRCVCAIFPVS